MAEKSYRGEASVLRSIASRAAERPVGPAPEGILVRVPVGHVSCFGRLEITNKNTRNGDSPASHTPAHDVTATVASFRTWRGSQLVIAGGPTGLPLSSLSERAALSRNDAAFARRYDRASTTDSQSDSIC